MINRADRTISVKLPADLKTWRRPLGIDSTHEAAEAIWKFLGPFFAERGYTLWQHDYFYLTSAGDDNLVANGYMYASVYRAVGEMTGGIQGVLSFQYSVGT